MFKIIKKEEKSADINDLVMIKEYGLLQLSKKKNNKSKLHHFTIFIVEKKAHDDNYLLIKPLLSHGKSNRLNMVKYHFNNNRFYIHKKNLTLNSNRDLVLNEIQSSEYNRRSNEDIKDDLNIDFNKYGLSI